MRGQRKRNIARKIGLHTIGIGGINCPCCGIPPKWRNQWFKLAKKRERRESERYESKAEGYDRTGFLFQKERP